MGRFFVEGGAGMFPTALFGLFLFATAVLHAMRPDRKLGMVVVLLGAVTIGSGVLGLSMGLVATTRGVSMMHMKAPQGTQANPPEELESEHDGATADERVQILAAGTAESLNNLILAMLLFIPSALVGTVGAYRASRRPVVA